MNKYCLSKVLRSSEHAPPTASRGLLYCLCVLPCPAHALTILPSGHNRVSRTRPASTQAGNAICASQIGRAEDCGYWGIRKAACENRGCCFDSNAAGPQCCRPNVTVAVSIEGCFDVVELPKSEASQHYNSHRPSRQVCSTGGDRAPVVSVRASDNPVLLMNSQ